MRGSIFRYPGGKSRTDVRKAILAVAPDHYKEYREPMVGGGGIYFGIDLMKRRWINDINPNLIAVYQALKERPQEFIAMCQAIKPMQAGEPEVYPKEGSQGRKYNARLKSKFDELAFSEDADPALRYFFVNRTVWGGRVRYDMHSRLYFSNPQGWNIVKGRKLYEAAQLLNNTKVTCGDYACLFNTTGTDVWIYADPPYMKDTELVDSSKLYNFGFDVAEHERLARIVHNCSHKVCISYDDHPKVRELYPETVFTIKKLSWKYSGTSSAESQNCDKSKRDGQELLITNYRP